jgi:beta-lactamase class A
LQQLGLSNVTAAQVEEARGIAPVICVQNHYNLAHRDDDALIDHLAEGGIAYVPSEPNRENDFRVGFGIAEAQVRSPASKSSGSMSMADPQARISDLLAGTGLEAGFAAISVESSASIAVNGTALFPTASTFKVPVMVEVFAQARAGRFSLTDRIPYQEHYRTIGSGVMQALGSGLSPTIRDLVMLMIIVSDNTATDILCDLVGLEHVTARMRALGLADIHIPLPCSGLFRKGWSLPMDGTVTYAELKSVSKARAMPFTSGAYTRDGSNNVTSAVDMARLMVLIARNSAGTPADCADMIAIMEYQHYQDRIPRYLPTGSVANKTGSLPGLRNDVGLIRRGPGDTIAYGMFTLDGTDMPHGNSRELAEANARISALMGDVGIILWDEFR